MNSSMKETYMDFVVKRDIVRAEDSDLNQSPSAEKSKLITNFFHLTIGRKLM